MSKRHPTFCLMIFGLFLSGAGGLVNQVVWQRALKIFLGGSETISSMIVVLVFLGGLGIGSVVSSKADPAPPLSNSNHDQS
jgi:hypothetical protein